MGYLDFLVDYMQLILYRVRHKTLLIFFGLNKDGIQPINNKQLLIRTLLILDEIQVYIGT